MKTMLSMLLVPAAVYAGLCLLLFVTQRSQIYFPVPERQAPGAAALRVQVTGAELKLWTVARAGPRALLYFGGNAEDVGMSIAEYASRLPSHSLYFVNYRGYGGSTGRPSEPVLVGDAIALHDRLRARHRDIDVLGRSLGSGVAVQLASEREVGRLVLVTPFDSLVNVARFHFPWLPVGLLMRDRYDSASRAPAVAADVLIVIAGADQIIPRARSDALAAAFGTAPRTVVLDAAGHNDLDFDRRYLDSVVEFLGR